jgi:pimeloyl-ACP methyl ester carboxylesterase
MKKYIYTLLIALCTMNLWAQTNREVIWLHGLGTNAASWQNTPQQFNTSFMINSRVRSYNSHAGVLVYSDSVRNRYAKNANNILIGHSMGGVVARDVLVKDRDFGGGLISIGSPLNGAFIANSKSLGRVSAKLSQGVTYLTADPIASGIPDLVLTFMNQNFSAQELVDNFLAGLNQELGLQSMSVGERDLMVQSPYMMSMRNANLNKPHLAIWGEEYAPVSVNYATTILNQLGITNRTKAEMRNLLSDAESVYLGFEVYYIVFSLALEDAFYKSSLWRDGKNFLKSDMEDDWNYLIGSNRTDYYQQCWQEMQCDWDDYFNGGNMQRSASGPISECPTITVCSSVPVRINEPSDGYIDAFSQRGQLYAQRPSAVVRALGVNHHEEQTHQRVRDIIRDAFDGQHGEFFGTTRR